MSYQHAPFFSNQVISSQPSVWRQVTAQISLSLPSTKQQARAQTQRRQQLKLRNPKPPPALGSTRKLRKAERNPQTPLLSDILKEPQFQLTMLSMALQRPQRLFNPWRRVTVSGTESTVTAVSYLPRRLVKRRVCAWTGQCSVTPKPAHHHHPVSCGAPPSNSPSDVVPRTTAVSIIDVRS